MYYLVLEVSELLICYETKTCSHKHRQSLYSILVSFRHKVVPKPKYIIPFFVHFIFLIKGFACTQSTTHVLSLRSIVLVVNSLTTLKPSKG